MLHPINQVITKIILTINVAVFVITAALSQEIMWIPAENLVFFGANYGPFTVDGQWWRLVSSVFLHAGLIHILFNSIILYQIGSFVEVLLTKKLYLAIYLVTGICASITSLIFNYGVVSIGASGAIFGLFGFFAAMLTTKIFSSDFKKRFIKSTWLFIGINLLIGTLGPIDNAAHIGGLVSGFILGIISTPIIKESVVRRLTLLSQNSHET